MTTKIQLRRAIDGGMEDVVPVTSEECVMLEDGKKLKEVIDFVTTTEDFVDEDIVVEENLVDRVESIENRIDSEFEQQNSQIATGLSNIKTIEQNISNKVDTEVAKVNAQLSQIDVDKANKSDVAKISIGTPLFANNVDEMTDNTRNYVNTSDGYLYIYTEGGFVKTSVLYQSTGIADDSIQPKHLSNDLIDALKKGYIEKYDIPSGDWVKQGWDGNNLINTTNHTSYRKNYIKIEGDAFIDNINASEFEVWVLLYDDDNSFVKREYAPISLKNAKFKLNVRSLKGLDFYNMSQTDRDNKANEICKIYYSKIDNDDIDNTDVEKFDKPFVIFSFDWYTWMFQKRYEIMKGEYGFNATFCLDDRTSNYNLTTEMPRSEFNKLIENGWDYAPYGGVGDRGSTEESWTNYIKGIIDQKENIGIFNPVMYNAPDNNNSDIVSNAVKNNGIKLHRCTTTDNLIKTPTQFKTGANFLSSTTLTALKSQIEKCIENNYGMVIYTHKVIDDGSTPNDGQDATQGHCYEWAFREILDYIKERVDTGRLEVLTASDFYHKYNTTDSITYDENRQTKRFNFLCGKVETIG